MSAKIKACFNGCSFTWGDGFSAEERDRYVYDRLVSAHFDFERTNIALSGSSNYKIFMRSVDAIMSSTYDIVFVQWSVLNRIWFSPGPDTHFYVNDQKRPDFRYRDLYISASQNKNLKNLLLLLNHDYQNIIDLISYCKVLNSLTQQRNMHIVHINGLVPWTDDLIHGELKDLSQQLSDYTKNLLDFDNRNDDEIIKYLYKLREKFKELDLTNWVNLFDSFSANMVDKGTEGHHPGIQSHQWMANQVITHLKERKIA